MYSSCIHSQDINRPLWAMYVYPFDHAKASRIPCIEKSTKACKGSPSLKACLWQDQKPSVPGSAQPREGEQNPNHWRIFQGMQRLIKSQSLFMARPEAKRARICSTAQRQAESQALKNFLRRVAKPYAKPEPARPDEDEQILKRKNNSWLQHKKVIKNVFINLLIINIADNFHKHCSL